MIRSNSWLWRAISPTPAPTPPSLTSGNFYSCHLLSQMTQLFFQLPSQHPAPSPSFVSRLRPFGCFFFLLLYFIYFFSILTQLKHSIFPNPRPTFILNLRPATISSAALSLTSVLVSKVTSKSKFNFSQFQVPSSHFKTIMSA